MLLAMAVSPYRVTPARIGNSSGLRLPAAFYRDHPQFAGAAGQVEVLSDDTLLLRLESQEQQDSEVLSLPLRDWGLIRDWLAEAPLPNDRLVGQILDMIDAEALEGSNASD